MGMSTSMSMSSIPQITLIFWRTQQQQLGSEVHMPQTDELEQRQLQPHAHSSRCRQLRASPHLTPSSNNPGSDSLGFGAEERAKGTKQTRPPLAGHGSSLPGRGGSTVGVGRAGLPLVASG